MQIVPNINIYHLLNMKIFIYVIFNRNHAKHFYLLFFEWNFFINNFNLHLLLLLRWMLALRMLDGHLYDYYKTTIKLFQKLGIMSIKKFFKKTTSAFI